MAQRAAEAVRFFARQFRVGHAGHVDKAAHPEQGIQEETVEVDHPAVRIALQEGVDHAGRLFRVGGEVADAVTRRHRHVVAPCHRDRAQDIGSVTL